MGVNTLDGSFEQLPIAQILRYNNELNADLVLLQVISTEVY